MRFFVRKRKQTPTVIIVALIDVLIVLLIFLIVTTTFKQQPSLRLALPESTQAQKSGANDNPPLVVSVDAQGNFRFGSEATPVTVDRLRSVRTEQFKYIRNFHPPRPHLQPNAYKDAKATVQRLRELHAQGKLSELPERLLFSPARPAEELYDVQADPFETKNLVADPQHGHTLDTLRHRLDGWMRETGDRGPESEKMYDSDMAVYLKKPNPVVEQNIKLNKRWAKEGK